MNTRPTHRLCWSLVAIVLGLTVGCQADGKPAGDVDSAEDTGRGADVAEDTAAPRDTGTAEDMDSGDDVEETGLRWDTGPTRDTETSDAAEVRPWLEHCKARAADAQTRTYFQKNSTCLGRGKALFEDVTLRSGVIHRHRFPKRAIEEHNYGRAVGGGVAMADFDGDRNLDLYISNGDGPNRMFINRGNGTFLDCTTHAGVGLEGDWTNGVSAADWDNDGDQDLYVANTGPDRLLRNDGDLQFTDVTQEAAIDVIGRSGTASWGDLDGDGHLDLVVSSLAEIGTMHEKGSLDDQRQSSKIYENGGDGLFVDHSQEFGTGGLKAGASYTMPLIDLNEDGDLDLFFLAEFSDNSLWRNDGVQPGRWVQWTDVTSETTKTSSQAPMGISPLDVNNDGRMDLSVSNLWGHSPLRESLLVNSGGMRFKEMSREYNAFAMTPTRRGPYLRGVSWSTLAFDADNDRDEDLYLVYGHITQWPDSARGKLLKQWSDPKQPNAFLKFDAGNAEFEVRTGTCAEDRGQGRGAAVGDLNGDGCLDLVVVNQMEPARVLYSRCQRHDGHWVELKLVGRRSPRGAVGAKVTVEAGSSKQTQHVLAGSRGVHSSSPRRLHFGLGEADTIDEVRIRWPSGQLQTVDSIQPGGLRVIREPKRSD